MALKKVRLRKDIDYVYCFFKNKVIKEEECDYYKHNLECDENHDIFGRTHMKGTNSGCTYQYAGSTPVLNSCKYCIEKDELYEEFYLPQDVTHNQMQRLFKRLREL